MMKIVFGTSNPAKVAQIQSVLEPVGIEVVGLGGQKIEVEEDGVTAEENARKKALAYSNALGAVVLSMDNALYLDGVSEEEQPGIHVCRIAGKTATTDYEMVEYYAGLANRYGGELGSRWHFALAIAKPDGSLREHTVIAPPRRLVDTPCIGRQEGYPLESLQIDGVSGKYVAEMTTEEHDIFWQRTIGQEIADFVKSALEELSA